MSIINERSCCLRRKWLLSDVLDKPLCTIVLFQPFLYDHVLRVVMQTLMQHALHRSISDDKFGGCLRADKFRLRMNVCLTLSPFSVVGAVHGFPISTQLISVLHV